MTKSNKRKSSLLSKNNAKDILQCHLYLGLIGTDTSTGDDVDDVMDCMAELDQRQGVALPPVLHDADRSKDNMIELTSIFRKQDSFNYKTLNAQIEVSRHNFASKLSRWLIESCTNLRIASFERWIIDSKMEENQKLLDFADQHDDTTTILNHHQKYLARRFSAKNKSRDKPRGVDVLLPSTSNTADKATQNLMDEIIDTLSSSPLPIHKKKQMARHICTELCTKSMAYARALEKQAMQQQGSVGTSSSSNKIKLERTNPNQYSLILEQQHKKTFCVRINAAHYHRLLKVFSLRHPVPKERQQTNTRLFHLLLFVMIVRYSTMAGGQQCCLKDSRGGGMQGAIHTEVFDFLKQFFFQTTSNNNNNVLLLECFASPLNTASIIDNQNNVLKEDEKDEENEEKYYCSAFQDLGEVDAFGSIGDFFNIPVGSLPDGCCCEANPPFSPLLMTAMAHRIEQHLISSCDKKHLLTFVVIVPTTATSDNNNNNTVQKAALESFLLLKNSKFLKKHTILKSKEHGYIEASQHIRSTQYKESQYDTSVFLLQSTSSTNSDADILNVGDTTTASLSLFEAGIRKAFASKHRQELMERLGNKIIESSTSNENNDEFDVTDRNVSSSSNVPEKRKKTKESFNKRPKNI